MNNVKYNTYRVTTIDRNFFRIEKYVYGVEDSRAFKMIKDWIAVDGVGRPVLDPEDIQIYYTIEDACHAKMFFERDKLDGTPWKPVQCKDCFMNKHCK